VGSVLALALVRLGTWLLAKRAGCPVAVTLDVFADDDPAPLYSLARTYGEVI